MVLHELSQLSGVYAHVYLSPHLDDASLSCGGTIARQTDAGEAVLVVTICTAAPPAVGPFSALAEEFHRAWGLSPAEVMATRLREDQASLALLGADSFLAGMLDAIYRYPAAYHRRETLFGQPAPGDPLLPALQTLFSQLRGRLPQARFYAPLGVGNHVDHLLTFAAARASLGAELRFYEDFPYVAQEGALERRLAQIGAVLQADTVAIEATLPRKLQAVQTYASQIDELAHSQLGHQVSGAEAVAVMCAAVGDYAQRVGGERYWSQG